MALVGLLGDSANDQLCLDYNLDAIRGGILLSSSGPGPSLISISKLKKRTRADVII